jgi:hypothetical protein
MTIEERVQKLETALLSILSRGEQKSWDNIHANQFILEDKKGNVRAFLAMEGNRPALTMCGEDGKPVATLTVIDGSPALSLFDDVIDKTQMILSVTKSRPSLSIGFTNDGVPLAELTVSKGCPVLCLADENGKPRAILSVSKEMSFNAFTAAVCERKEDDFSNPLAALIVDQAGLKLFNKDGKPVWSAP